MPAAWAPAAPQACSAADRAPCDPAATAAQSLAALVAADKMRALAYMVLRTLDNMLPPLRVLNFKAAALLPGTMKDRAQDALHKVGGEGVSDDGQGEQAPC